MNTQLLTEILLSIVGSVGILIATQLLRIANTVKKIDTHLQVLSSEHLNLKNEVFEIKGDVKKGKEEFSAISNRVIILEQKK